MQVIKNLMRKEFVAYRVIKHVGNIYVCRLLPECSGLDLGGDIIINDSLVNGHNFKFIEVSGVQMSLFD